MNAATALFDEARKMLQEITAFNTDNSDALEQFRIAYLGSKGKIKKLFGHMRQVPREQKREFGQLANAVKQAAEAKVQEIKVQLEAKADEQIVVPDMSLPVNLEPLGSRHPIAIMQNKICEIFARIGFTIAEGPEIEDDWHNFTAMNTPKDHPARDMQDTFYIEKDARNMLLRTHTSSVQARVMTTQKPPIRIIAPGRVYRNETISARAHCQFHQIEGLYIDENVSFADLKQTLYYFAREMYGQQVKVRFRPSFFPFTEPSAEMDVSCFICEGAGCRVCKYTSWVEILGCGMVDPAVLANCGIDPERYSGFAFGMGIERPAMLKYRINDIRLMFENDVRFLQQFSGVV